MKWKSMNGAQRFTFFPFAEETRQIEKERLKGVKVNWVGWFGCWWIVWGYGRGSPPLLRTRRDKPTPNQQKQKSGMNQPINVSGSPAIN